MITSANYPGETSVVWAVEEILVSQNCRNQQMVVLLNMQWKTSDDQISVKFRFANGKVVGP